MDRPPAGYRWALTLAVVVGLQVCFSAVLELDLAIDPTQPIGSEDEFRAFPADLWTPLLLARRSGIASAVLGMQGWRIGTELLLAVSCAVLFVLAVRLRLRPEAPEEAAQHVSVAALVVAVIRTIEGAESTVIASSAGKRMTEVLQHLHPDDPVLQAMGAFPVGSMLWSLLMVGVFVWLSNYFRSDRVRDFLRRAEP